MNLGELKAYYGEAELSFSSWYSDYLKIGRYFLPDIEYSRIIYSNQLNGNLAQQHQSSVGKSYLNRVYDSTARLAARTLSDRVQSILVPPQQQWVRLVPLTTDEIDPSDVGDMKKQFQELEKKMFHLLHNTNFDKEIGTVVRDLVLGIGILKIEIGPDKVRPFVFESISPVNVQIACDYTGEPNIVFRKLTLTPVDAKRQWPDGDFSSLRANDKHEFIEATYPVDSLSLGKTGRKDGYVYGVYDPGFSNEYLRREMLTSPFIICRWESRSGFPYGDSPASMSLSECMLLREVDDSFLKRVRLQLKPLMLMQSTSELAFGNADLVNEEAFRILKSDTEISPINFGGVEMGQLEITDLRNQIKKVFMLDLLDEPEGPVRTATEIMQRQARFTKRMSSTLANIEHELIHKTVLRLLDIMQHYKLISNFTGEQLVLDGGAVSFRAKIPLNESKDSDDMNAMMTLAQFVQSTIPAEIGLQITNLDEVLTRVLDNLHLPASLLKSKTDIKKVVEQYMQSLADAKSAKAY